MLKLSNIKIPEIPVPELHIRALGERVHKKACFMSSCLTWGTIALFGLISVSLPYVEQRHLHEAQAATLGGALPSSVLYPLKAKKTGHPVPLRKPVQPDKANHKVAKSKHIPNPPTPNKIQEELTK